MAAASRTPDPLAGAGPALVTAYAIRFVLELLLLGAAATAGWGLFDDPWRWVAVIVAPLVVVTIWASLLSPRAPLVIPEPARVVIEAVLFAAAAAGLWLLGAGVLGLILVAVWAIDRIAIALLRRRSR